MKITFFFRKPNPHFYSIEGLFKEIQQGFNDKIKYENLYSPHSTSGIKSVILNGLFARKNQGAINHITGDIHYVALFLNKKNTILTIHDLVNLNIPFGIKKVIFKLLWFTLPVKNVRFITVISESTKKELLEKVKVDERMIKVIPDCVSPDFKFSPFEFNKICPAILHIGTKPNKNLPNLIKALSGINCKLVILGKLKEEHVELLKDHKIKYENCFNISQEELVKLYERVDMLSFVSTYEGFGLPVVEAQATGRPVITSNISSMPEVAGDGALLVDPFNVKEIRDGILKIINEHNLRETLITKGFQNVKRFKPDSIAKMYYELYELIQKEK